MKINCVIVDDDISSQKKISEAIARLSIQGDLDFQCTYFSDPLNSEILEHLLKQSTTAILKLLSCSAPAMKTLCLAAIKPMLSISSEKITCWMSLLMR